MEKLLERKGIKVATYIDEDKTFYKYAYTDQMFRNKIFIEYYQFEDELGDIPEYETGISVYLSNNIDTYDFTILYDMRDVIPPLYLYRIILDLIEIIESSDLLSLEENLKQVATTYIHSKEFSSDPEIKKNFDERVAKKIELVLRLIDQSKIDGK